MSATSYLQPENINTLSNIHNTFKEHIENLFTVYNASTGSVVPDYNATTKALMDFVGQAAQKKKQVRALGGNWSFTKVGYTSGWMINTRRMNIMKRLLPEEVLPSYGYKQDDLLFAQCGCSIQELSRILRTLGRSLKASGASNGQTIAGAVATGTHGAAIDFGATQEFIVGIHLIVSPTKHLYLER